MKLRNDAANGLRTRCQHSVAMAPRAIELDMVIAGSNGYDSFSGDDGYDNLNGGMGRDTMAGGTRNQSQQANSSSQVEAASLNHFDFRWSGPILARGGLSS